MAVELIEGIYDIAAIEAQQVKVIAALTETRDMIVELNATRIGAKSASLTEFSAATKELNAAINNTTLATKQAVLAGKEQQAMVKSAQLDLLELKKRNAELTIQAKEKLAADKEALAAARERSVADKKAAADAVAAGRERIAQLRAEQEANEKLEADIKSRAGAEQANLSGNFNPGGGRGNSVASTPLNLTVDQGNILLVKQYEAEIANLNATMKDAKAQQAAGTISTNQYKQVIITSTEKINGYKKGISELNTEMKLNAAVNDAERNSLGRAQALIAQYTNAKKTLNLATAEGRLLNDNYNKAIVNTNKFILANADAETVRTKTVGKYENAILSAGSKAFSFIRQAALLIPGLGISGIFLGIYEGIKYAIEALGLFNSKLSETKQNQQDLAEISTKAADIGAGDIANLELLRSKIVDLSLPLKDRNIAIKEYNDIADKSNQIDIKNINSTNELNSAIDRQIELIGRQAIATAFKNKLAEAAAKVFDAEQKVRATSLGKEIDDIDKVSDAEAKADQKAIAGKKVRFLTQKELNKLEAEGLSPELQKKANDYLLNTEKKRQATIQLKQSSEYKEYLTEKQNFDRLLNLSKDYVSADSLITKKGKEKTEAIVKESTKTQLDSDFELYKIAQTRKIKVLDDGVNDEKLNFNKRIDLLNQASTARLELIDESTKDELRKNKEKEDALQANLVKAKGTERNNLLTEIANTKTARKVIEAKALTDRLAVFDDNEKKFNDLTDKAGQERLRIQKRNYDKAMELVEAARNNERAILDSEYKEAVDGLQTRYDKQEISQKEFTERRLRLDYDYYVASLNLEIKKEKQILAIRLLSGQDISKEKAALADLEKKIALAGVKLAKDTEKEKMKATLDTLETIKKAYEDTFNVIGGLVNISVTNQKNALQDQQNEAEKKAAHDIELVNASTASEEEKAAKIAVINARLQAQKDQIAQKQKQADLEKARFEKAQAIFGIIINTALAVVRAGVITPQAILAGVLGAAQLAIAIATPLPKYKHGRGEGVEEMAITGDGGVSEYIVRGDGSIERTPAVETLTHLMPKDRVLPNKAALMKELAMQILPASGGRSNGGIDKADIRNLADRIDEAVGNIKIVTQLTTKEGQEMITRRYASQEAWVNKYIKG